MKNNIFKILEDNIKATLVPYPDGLYNVRPKIGGFLKATDEILKLFPSWTKMSEKLPEDKTYCYVRFKNKTDWCFYNRDMNIDSRFIAGNFGWVGGSDYYSESEAIEYFPESELLKFLKLKEQK